MTEDKNTPHWRTRISERVNVVTCFLVKLVTAANWIAPGFVPSAYEEWIHRVWLVLNITRGLHRLYSRIGQKTP